MNVIGIETPTHFLSGLGNLTSPGVRNHHQNCLFSQAAFLFESTSSLRISPSAVLQSPLILIHPHTRWPKPAALERYNVTLAHLNSISIVPIKPLVCKTENVMELSAFGVTCRTKFSRFSDAWNCGLLESWWFSQLSSVVDPRATNVLMMCIQNTRRSDIQIQLVGPGYGHKGVLYLHFFDLLGVES